MKKQKKQKQTKQRKAGFILILLFAAAPLSAQNIERFFVDMPDVLNPVLNKKQRIELLEYYKADMGDSIENVFGNQTHIIQFDTLNNYISVKNTGVSTFEMKIFVLNNNDTVIGIIRTVCTPLCQSAINFYDASWNKYAYLNFTMPKTSDWIDETKIDETGLGRQDVYNALNLSFISLSFVPERDEIAAENHSLEYLEEKDKQLLTPVVSNDKFIYHLNGMNWSRK